MKFIVLKNQEEVGNYVAKMFIDQINKKPNSVLGMATGSSPVPAYEKMVEDHAINNTDWSKVVTFNLDEYVGLEETHEQSYRYFMNDVLLNHVNVNLKNTFVPNGVAKDLEKEAEKYENLLKKHGPIDLQVLGVGVNGHIAFNEPPAPLDGKTGIVDLVEDTIKANARFFEKESDVPRQGLTMGVGSIMKAKQIILVATGKNKAEAISKLQGNDYDENWPCTSLIKHDNAVVVLDEDAASLLK
ncbi:glucosamine-6-phosphate deaminase [Spiroplasma endosymbiont of Anurida maritima]|uniref:glucosamine-6-phosphate deaminase n=1 Tax=Spiroplasma endosymbiont of Anurida maritima TaxID=2967972 RepID=UPI0036D2D49F